MSHDAKSHQRIYSIEKKLEKNDFTFGYNVHGGGDYNKSQECFLESVQIRNADCGLCSDNPFLIS